MVVALKIKTQRWFWEDGRIGSTRNLSSHLDNNCMAEFVWYNYFGTLESLPGKGLDGKQWLVSLSALRTAAAIHPPIPVAGNCEPVPRVTYTHLVGGRVGKKDPVLQISDICALFADCFFWSQRWQPLLLHLSSLPQAPLLLDEVMSIPHSFFALWATH